MIEIKLNLDLDNEKHMRALSAFAETLAGETCETAKRMKTPKVETQKAGTQKDETQKVETQKAGTQKAWPQKDETQKDETQKDETQKVETPKVETQKVETPKVETQKAETDAGVTLEELKTQVKARAGDQNKRDKMKAELDRLGAENVSKLDPAKYEGFYNFVIEL